MRGNLRAFLGPSLVGVAAALADGGVRAFETPCGPDHPPPLTAPEEPIFRPA